MAGGNLLVIEDDEAVSELLDFHLTRQGFTVLVAHDAESAWASVAESDLVVLDRMLPGMDGLEFLRRLREGSHRDLPVLMLTALASEVDRVTGLEEGADDYLVKPFSVAELVARVRALIRRTGDRPRRVAGVEVDVVARRVSRGGQEVVLTRREFDLLQAFLDHPGRVFTRAQLLDRVWGHDFVGGERTVDQHVAQLRGHLGPELIETVRGRGYRLGHALD